MKRLLIGSILLLVVAGCAVFSETGSKGTGTMRIDEDGDGVYDVVVFTEPDGTPTDREVQGSREELAAARAAADILKTTGIIGGYPVVGLIGGVLGMFIQKRRKTDSS
jgi:hypothetical protein